MKLQMDALKIQNEAVQLQRDAAKVKEDLALNVIVKTRVVRRGAVGWIAQVDVKVTNLSNRDYYAPGVYITAGTPVDSNDKAALNGRTVHASCLRKTDFLGTRNMSRYANMSNLSSGETEVFTTFFLLDGKQAKENPTILVWVEVIGASSDAAGGLGDAKVRRDLFAFMNSNDEKAHNFNAFGPWLKGYEEEREREGMPKKKDRCIYEPPADLLEKPTKVDVPNTLRFGRVLDSTVVWDRFAVVSLDGCD